MLYKGWSHMPLSSFSAAEDAGFLFCFCFAFRRRRKPLSFLRPRYVLLLGRVQTRFSAAADAEAVTRPAGASARSQETGLLALGAAAS